MRMFVYNKWVVENIDNAPSLKELNQLGNEGWELISFDIGSHGCMCLIKKEIVETVTLEVQQMMPARNYAVVDEKAMGDIIYKVLKTIAAE